MSRAGHSITRLPRKLLEHRLEIVRELTLLGHTESSIAAAILRNDNLKHLLARQADPTKTVKDARKAIEKAMAERMKDYAPASAFFDYQDRLEVILAFTSEVMHDDTKPMPVRNRSAELFMEASQALAQANGIPVNRPAISIDFNAQMLHVSSGLRTPPEDGAIETIEGEVISRSEPTTFGLVDAYTFATHADYCALNLDDKPMERMILQDFMRAGSGYNELINICGMRSGKGTVGSVIAWYKIYRLLELSNPQRFYGLTPGQSIGTVNMALSEDQAKINVFKHIKDRIDHGGRWFQDLRGFCERSISNWRLELELRLPKNLQMRCGHSRARSLVGGTNIAVVFDELCKYKSTEGNDNAEAVYNQMKATTATFGEESLIVSLSSPEWEGDYGMTLLKMAKEHNDSDIEDRCETCRPLAEDPNYLPTPSKSHPRMFGIQMPTWEANLTLTYERLWDSQNGAANPRAFWRDFGAKPAEAQEAYYPDPSRWDKQPDLALRYPYDNLGRLQDWFKPCCPSRRFVHVDLAVSRDAAGIAMAHKPVPGCPWYTTITGEGGLMDNPSNRKAVVDICVQIKPEPKTIGQTTVEIDFDAVRGLIYTWQERGFPIKDGKVTYDGFQSVDSRQQLRKKGFRSEEFSVDRNLKAHDTLQELINTDQVAYPSHPVLIREGKQLQLKNGRKVDHPPRGCFTADTRIALLDGSNPRIDELIGLDGFWVFSLDPCNALTVGFAHSARMTEPDAELVEIILDDFTPIRCTPDHRFRLINGTYKEARDLTADDRLAPLYRQAVMEGGWQGYVRAYDPANAARNRPMLHQIVGQWLYGPTAPGMIYHHRDHNGLNNDPGNIELTSKIEHARYHTALRHKTDPGYNLKVRLGVAAYARSPEGRQKSRDTILANMDKLNAGTQAWWNSAVGQEGREAARQRLNERQASMQAARRHGNNHRGNHRVISIQPVNRADVFDITVEPYNNFALTAGVFVHNSKDVIDAVAGSVFHAVSRGGQRSFIGGKRAS